MYRSSSSHRIKGLFYRRLRLVPFVISLAASTWIFAGSAFAAIKVQDREGLIATIRAKGVAKVIVRINMPETEKLLEASARYPTLKPNTDAPVEMMQADGALANHVSSMVNSTLAKLDGTAYKVNRTYKLFPMVALDVSEEALMALESRPEVLSVSPDIPRDPPSVKADDGPSKRVTELHSKSRTPRLYSHDYDLIGAANAWAAGYTGKGWYVAILDSGVLTKHELFIGKNIVEACFAGNADCPNRRTTMIGPGAAAPFNSSYNGYEHGTHVAGIAVGNSGSQFGVAKDANLIAVEVFTGYTTTEDCPNRTPPCARSLVSDQIAALDYIYSLRGTYPIASVNMSLGGGAYSDQAACDADNGNEKFPIDMLRSAGIATVISAGNEYYCNALGGPGCLSSAISVGAVDDYDVQVDYSNWHYGMLRLLAPGYKIYSGLPDSTTSYGDLSGTSMAAPHVAGAWAVLKQARPSASVSDIYYALAGTGVPVHSDCPHINDYKPRIQLDAALSPSILNAPQRILNFSYDPTASPTFGTGARPVGVGTVSGTGSTVDLTVGFCQFSAPVDIYLALYAPTFDSSNYYIVTPGSTVQALSRVGLIAWKTGVTGPIDESLFGPLASSGLPAGKYYVYIMVTPSGVQSPYYLWQTDFIN